MTEPQHTALARMSDSQQHLGADVTRVANTLAELRRAGFIRMVQDTGPLIVCMWMITPEGLRALEVAA